MATPIGFSPAPTEMVCATKLAGIDHAFTVASFSFVM
jgi:hypothetical protein